jgi:Domain of unknown function (DUF4932)/Bacterial Ig-like domain
MRRRVLRFLFSLTLAAVGLFLSVPAIFPGASGTPAGPKIRVLVDPRIELMSVVFRLAGNPEYRQGSVASYVADVERHFGGFKNHAAVARVRSLRASRGISYNAPMSLAVYLTDAETLGERVPLDPLPPGVDERWRPADARAFLADLRAFVRETDFMSFFKAHQPLYQTAVNRLEQELDSRGRLAEDWEEPPPAQLVEWFDGFFGGRPGADFIIILGMLNGGASYGASARRGDGGEEIYSILGVWVLDVNGQPKFDRGILSTVAHEFCHSYTNPLLDKHKTELRPAGEKIFPYVAGDMKRQAYGDWLTMMYESLDRACGVRYALFLDGRQAAAKEAAANREKGFLWTGELADLLGEYETHRDTYPTLDAFFPRIVAFFDAYCGRVERDLAAVVEEKRKELEALKEKSPKIVSLIPADGAQDVDPDLEAIVVTFDRPMKRGNIAVMVLDQAKFPKTPGRAVYNPTGTMLKIPVTLEPGREYVLGLNGPGYLVMQDDLGHPLAPVVIKFKTRK